MDDLARLDARIASLKEMSGLFSAMQALAASRVQAAHTALASVRSYAATIEHAIGDAVAMQSGDLHAGPIDTGHRRSAFVVISSEHGFAGSFNRVVLERARSAIAATEDVLIVGRRGATIAKEHDLTPVWSMPMATHVDGILASARRLAARLVEAECVRVAYGTYEGGGILQAQVRQVLPLAPDIFTTQRAGGAVPLLQLPPEVLLRRLVGEFLLAELTLALTESFMSENVTRLQIMQSATHNIEDKLKGFTRRSRELRQEAITSELVEVIAGGEAVNSLQD